MKVPRSGLGCAASNPPAHRCSAIERERKGLLNRFCAPLVKGAPVPLLITGVDLHVFSLLSSMYASG